MPRVPTYDSLQVGQSQLPTPALQAPQVEATAATQAQQFGKTLSGIGQEAGQLALKLQEDVNRVRVNDALNQVKEAQLSMTLDPASGFTRLKGKDALERPGGKSLEEEYGVGFQKEIERIAGGLTTAQRAQFDVHAGAMLTDFRGRIMQHVGKEFDGYHLSQIEGMVTTASREIALMPGDEKAYGASMQRIRKGIEDQAKLTGQAPEWTDATVRKVASGAIRGAVTQLMDRDPHGARAFLDKHQNDMDAGDVVLLRNALDDAMARVDGERAGMAIYSGSGPVGSDFESIFRHVLKVEGGYVANDAGKGETNMGINKSANPDLDIKGMTVDKARQVYKQRYWNAIGGDSLPPQVRAIAFDAAVNHGPSFANKIIAQADGDPAKMIALRREEYARLVRENPAKFSKYAKSWESRLQSLEGVISGRRSMSGMLSQASQIADPRQRKMAEATIQEQAQRDELAQKEAYQGILSQAQTAAFAKVGGWRDVPPSVWSQLTREDQAKLIEGPKKASDPDTLLMLQQNPSLWRSGQIERFRGLLTEADYRKFYDDGNGPGAEKKILQATFDMRQFNDVLNQTGMYKMLTSKKEADKQTIIELQGTYQREIDAQQRAFKRALTLDEKNALLRQLIKPVMVKAVRTGSLFDGDAGTVEKRAFQVKNPQTIVVPTQVRQQITADMQRAGIRPTEQNILQAYLRMKQ